MRGALQQTKHFQRGSATVLCSTVKPEAFFIAQHFLRRRGAVAEKAVAMVAGDTEGKWQPPLRRGHPCPRRFEGRAEQIDCATVDMPQ
jgi:hypothetical protein